MRKQVSERANFVLYVPSGWTVHEGAEARFRMLSVSDPQEKCTATLFHGERKADHSAVAAAKEFAGEMGRKSPDLVCGKAMLSPDKSRVMFQGTYTDPKKGKREFRSWLSLRDGKVVYSSIEAPLGELDANKETLLTVLSNVRVIRPAEPSRPSSPPALVPRRLQDGSAQLNLPPDWSYQSFGNGAFIAKDPEGLFTFMVASVQVISPALGVRVPGTPVSPYLPPHRAFEFLTVEQGLASQIRFKEVIPKPEIARQIGQVYTSGPVTVEDFSYSLTLQGRKSRGYSYGISFGSHLGTNWRLWHMTAIAPEEKFDSFAPTFVHMLESYKINDAFAASYIARGMARLRAMQRQTMQMVSSSAEEIRKTMQAAYDERQTSQDYIDYQRTGYIRGEQDWVSAVEGGTVYHTDTWGTKNTVTEEFWEGSPYDYVHFKGENPKYNELMTPIDSRELWEAHIR